MIIRMIARIVVGITIGSFLSMIISGNDAFAWVWSVGLTLSILLIIAGASAGRSAGGTLGLARVETIQRTGRESDGAQECEVLFTVVPERGAPYSTTQTVRLAADELRTYAAGSVLPIMRMSASSPTIVVVDTPTPQWADRVQKARSDPSLIPVGASVPAWDPATMGSARRPRAWEWVVSIGITVAVIAVTLVPVYPLIGRGAVAIATGDWDAASMVTGNYQQQAVDEIAAVAGSYEFIELSFYDDYIIASARTSPGADTTDRFQWRYGSASREGADYSQPFDLEAELFDASELDFGMVAQVTKQAIADSPLADSADVYPRVNKDTETGQVLITVSMNDDYKSAQFVYTFSGEEVARNGSAFD